MAAGRLTLAIFKPDVQRIEAYRKLAEEAIRIAGLNPIVYREFYMTRERAEFFYFAHQGKFFYDRLVNYMISVASENELRMFIITGTNFNNTNLRFSMMDQSVYTSLAANQRLPSGESSLARLRSVLSQPNSLRGRLGLTDTRNGFHGSDSTANAEDEILFFFPTFDFEEELRKLHS